MSGNMEQKMLEGRESGLWEGQIEPAQSGEKQLTKPYMYFTTTSGTAFVSCVL
jgi:hypothetical protein